MRRDDHLFEPLLAALREEATRPVGRRAPAHRLRWFALGACCAVGLVVWRFFA